MNSVNLIGRLTDEPRFAYTLSNKAIAKFILAVDNPYKTDKSNFIRVVAWGKVAELVNQTLRKGMKIGLTGSIVTDSYKDSNDVMHYTTEVNMDQLTFCEKKAG